MYARKGDLDKGIADCTEAIRIAQPPLAYNNRCNVYVEKGDFNRAVADFTEAIRSQVRIPIGTSLLKALFKEMGVSATGRRSAARKATRLHRGDSP